MQDGCAAAADHLVGPAEDCARCRQDVTVPSAVQSRRRQSQAAWGWPRSWSRASRDVPVQELRDCFQSGSVSTYLFHVLSYCFRWVPPRSSARTTTAAARILSTILLRAGLRISPDSQSISHLSYLFQYPVHLSTLGCNFFRPLSHFFHPQKCYTASKPYRAETTGPRVALTAIEIPSASPIS